MEFRAGARIQQQRHQRLAKRPGWLPPAIAATGKLFCADKENPCINDNQHNHDQ